jgi:dephospho-CoA kinase
MQRDGASEDEVVRRMASQMDDAVKNRLASFVINNDGKEMLIPQVVKLHEKLITSKK